MQKVMYCQAWSILSGKEWSVAWAFPLGITNLTFVQLRHNFDLTL